jgi:CRP-like cAMP-binding protein
LAQLLQSSACAALHTVEARLCRWLLELQDRTEGRTALSLTHDFLAEMLGVQRTTVTVAAQVLQRAGLITYRRGQVTILDRAGLEDAACECHADIREQYERLLPVGGG